MTGALVLADMLGGAAHAKAPAPLGLDPHPVPHCRVRQRIGASILVESLPWIGALDTPAIVSIGFRHPFLRVDPPPDNGSGPGAFRGDR